MIIRDDRNNELILENGIYEVELRNGFTRMCKESDGIFIKYTEKADYNIYLNNVLLDGQQMVVLQNGDYLRIVNGNEEQNFWCGDVVGESWRMDIKLPFVIPCVLTYPYFTAIVGTLAAYQDDKVWVYNNYILLWMFKNIHNIDYWADFVYGDQKKQTDFCIMLKKEIRTIKDINLEYRNVVEAIIHFINQKKYVFVSLDVFFVDAWWGQPERYHYRHQVYVTGYNKDEQYFYISDFMANKKYKTIKIPFDIFEEAFYTFSDDRRLPYQEFGEDIWLLSYNVDGKQKLEIKRISSLMADFINAENTAVDSYLTNEGGVPPIVYGMDYFEELCLVLNELEEKDFVDLKILHLIVVLCDIMFDRMIYLKNNLHIELEEPLLYMMKENIKNSKKIQALAIKYNFCKNRKILCNIIEIVLVLKEGIREAFILCKKILDKLELSYEK